MNYVVLVFSTLILCGCSATRISMDRCKNDIYFDQLQANDLDKIDKRTNRQVSAEYFSFLYPRSVKLNKLILENGIKCDDLKKVEIEIKESFGLFNKIILRF